MTVGWGTFAYGLTSGIGAALAFVFVLIGARSRRSDPLMTSFGVFAFATALSAIVTFRLHTSSSLDAYAQTFKLFGLASLVGLIATVVLVAAWTNALPRRSLIAFGVATAFIAVLQLVLPNGLLAGEIRGLRSVELFGEQFVVHDGSTSPWRPALDVYVLSTVAMLLVALFRGYRRGDRRVAFVVTLSFLAGLAFSTYDSLVDQGWVDTPYLSPFGQALVVLAAAVFLADRLVRTDAQLHGLATQLEVTVVERTASLISANDQLEQQLAHQRQSNRNLAALGQAFEASNSLVGTDRPDARDSLERLIGAVGTTTGARSVELEITDETSSSVVPERLSWEAENDCGGLESDDTSFRLTEKVRIAHRTVGEVVARFASHVRTDSEESRYLDLAAEHLSGLINQLELVRQLTDTAIEQERQRIAMDLHDSVTQRMYSVAFLAEALVHSIDQNPQQAVETAQRLREHVLASVAELRSMLLELRPTALEQADLAHLLEELGGRLTSTTDLNVSVEAEPVPHLPADVKVAFFRIAQEAAGNACRHSGAETVSVQLRNDQAGTTLTIADEGIGFSLSDPREGHGLQNITSRAALGGLKLDASSTPGSGTTISVQWANSTEASISLEQGAEV